MIRSHLLALVTILIIFSPGLQLPSAADDDRLAALARDLQTDDEEVRTAAVTALAKVQDPQAVQLLIDAMSSKVPTDATRARMISTRSQGRFQFIQKVSQALGGMGEIAFEPLIAGLDAPDRSIRFGSAMALGHLGDERAIEPLIAALRQEPGRNMPHNSGAMSGLKQFGVRAVDPLIAALEGHDNSDIRANAAMGLAMFLPGSNRAVAPLINALQDGKPKVRSHAATALGHIGDVAAVEPLLALLKDSDKETRACACAALGYLKDDRAFDPLIDRLRDDQSSRVRMRAAESLGILENKGAFEPLQHALRHDVDWRVRGSAASALAKVDKDRAAEPLLAALSLKDAPPPENEGRTRNVTERLLDESCDPVENTREISDWDRGREMYLQNVVSALSNIRESRAVEPLIQMLDDQDPGVRRVASRTLGNLRDQRAVEPLKKAAEDKDPRVSRSAMESLQRLGHPRGGKTLESVDLPLSCTMPDQRTRRSTARALLQREGASEEIATMLENRDPEARAVALVALGLRGDPDNMELVTGYLGDEEATVRLCAVEALSRLHDPRMPLLMATLGNQREDPEVRAAAAKAIGELGVDEDLTPLLIAMQEDSAVIRREAAAALGNSRDRWSTAQLMEALSDDDAGVRAAAVASLGRLGHRRAVPRLIAALGDGDAAVRLKAVAALGMLEDDRAVEPLLHLLQDGSREYARIVIPALGQIGDPRAVEPLLAHLSGRYTRGPVLWALACIPDRLAIKTVIDSFDAGGEKPPEWNQSAGRLAKLGEPALDPLISALRNPSPGIRAGAAQALGTMKDKRAVEPLIRVLAGDENEQVRVRAATSLGWINDPRVIDPLTAALSDPSPAIRKGAVDGLGALKDERRLTPLTTALADRSADVRAAAAVQLALIDGPDAVAPLLAALKDEDDTVRRKAARALCNIQQDDPRIDRAIDAAVESWDLVIISGTYVRLVEQGNPDHLPLLEEVLTVHGYGQMAMDYSLCGNDRLEQAAKNWIASQQELGSWLPGTYSSTYPQWGRYR